VNRLDHGIVNCRGFEILESLPWKSHLGKKVTNQVPDGSNWGFLICTPPGFTPPGNESNGNKLYGTIGPIQTEHIQESCLAIPLHGNLNPQSAMSYFALACGLSIIEKSNLELGDTAVVSGANPLALSILVAATAQGARTACLVSDSEKESAYRQDIENVSSEILDFEDVSCFDDKLDRFVALSKGKTVYVDTVGQPGPVYAMAMRLKKFGTLVFCRQEVDSSVVLSLREVHHLKSAHYIYWARPENLEQALILSECCQRSANLFHWKRVRIPTFFPLNHES